ncbi:hypothetical protein TNCV_1035741 [Trichonephila clavipes]|nr:hypothetical protein TNCV_1035741 [Trichonephila clavipes]
MARCDRVSQRIPHCHALCNHRMPLNNKNVGSYRILGSLHMRMCWLSALILKWDSSLETINFQFIAFQLARGRQNSSRHCL